MERRPFGRTGLRVHPLAFGGGPIGFLDTDRARVERILNLLLDAGVNLVDTAAVYRGSEEAIGHAIGPRRAEYILVSKCGRSDDEIPGDAWSPALIHRTIDRCLERLRTDFIDVMLLHSCGVEVLARGEALAALAEARQAGKVRWVGYAGDNEAALEAATHDDIDVLEVSANICDQATLDTVVPVARARGLAVLAKRPIANAAWKDPAAHRGIYQDYVKSYADRLRRMELSPAALGLGHDDRSWTELALRFTLSHPGLHAAILGTTDPDHARENLAIAARGPLPPDTVARIRDAFRQAEQASATPWRSLS